MNVNSLDFSTAIEEVTHLMGLNPLKPKQTESLCAFVSGKDTFVTLPTGYGKWVVFAVLPLLFDKLLGRSYSPQHVNITVLYVMYVLFLGVQGTIVVVVTPLIALMIDQKHKLSKRGIRVEFVGEAQDNDAAVWAVLNGQIQLV